MAFTFIGVRGASTSGVVPPRGRRGMPERRRTAARAPRCVATACAALLPMTGCSFALVRPTPSNDPHTGYGQCRSVAYPVVDAIGAGALVALAVVGQEVGRGIAECGKYPNDSACRFSPLYFIPAMVAAASSIYGFWAVSKCESQLGAIDEGAHDASPGIGGLPSLRLATGGRTFAPHAPQRDARVDAAERTIP